ncbi:hypothetical protein PybrP1_003572 [[Pythium] brassicae (nom. inval.)]|nr:hypothetical protein PybrP1_003572 [[Pythium] brassicae (nom. inval.)]
MSTAGVTKMATAGAGGRRTQQELFRLVCTLSGACHADRNVLKDAQLVDLLETQAKAILLARRQQQQRKKSAAAAAAADAPTISPQRSKLIKKLADATAESGKDGVALASKRRKLSFESDLHKSPTKAPRSFDERYGHEHPAAESAAFAASVSVFNAAIVDQMSRSAAASCPLELFKAPGAFKSLDHGSEGVDLSASMASTITSTAPGYYDDLYDDLSPADARYRRSHSPGLDSHGRRTPLSELTQSVDSIDWCPSDDDEEDDELMEHSCSKAEAELKSMMGMRADDDEAAGGRVSPATATSTEVVMQVLFDIMQHDRNYKWLVNPENQARVAKLVASHQRQQHEDDAENAEASGKANDETAAGAAAQLHAQVEALMRENERIQSENARLAEANHMSACDAEEQTQRVHELLAKLQAAAAAPTTAKPAPRTDAETRLAASLERLSAQEACRREAEAAFASELSAQSETVASLKHELGAKDSEISALMAQVAAISAAFAAKAGDSSVSLAVSSGLRRLSLSSQKGGEAAVPVDADASMILHLREVNVARENEVKRLRSVLQAKDREICSLYMHLSTKKTLVDEISSRLVQQVQALAAARGEAAVPIAVEDLDLDLDLFLFKRAAAKQQTADELTAALGVMEREVESLEERAETLESENYTLKVTQEDLASTLESANAEFLRVSAENELMEASLKEKQTRIRNLMLYLEEKEDQIMRLKDAAEQQLRPAFAGIGSSYAVLLWLQ